MDRYNAMSKINMLFITTQFGMLDIDKDVRQIRRFDFLFLGITLTSSYLFANRKSKERKQNTLRIQSDTYVGKISESLYYDKLNLQ